MPAAGKRSSASMKAEPTMPTLPRTLALFEEAGFLSREPGGRAYVIGERLSRFALDVLRSDSAAAERRLILQRVVGEITETCNLAVLKKGALIYLDRIEAPWPLRLHVPEGGVALPPHCCASGKLLLAHLAAAERQRLLERMPLQRFTERTLTDRAVLESELARIVSVGYAVDNEEYVLGVACVAVPVRNRRDEVIAAVAVQGATARLPLMPAIEFVPRLPGAARERWPLLSTDGLTGAVFLPKDGRTNPVDTTQALARGARSAGVRIVENLKVTGIRSAGGRVSGVATEAGEVRADAVVNCAGLWAREVGAWAGVSVPLHAAEHFYIVTQPIAGLAPDLPVLRDADARSYFKEDTGKLLVGWFEPEAKPWGWQGIPENFAFEHLPADLGHIEPLFAAAMRRVPALESAGVQVFFNGPESFTPDDRYLLGEATELRGLYVAAALNSIGIQSAGGAGKVLARWILDGHPPFDLWDVDIRRCAPFQRNRRYLRERTVETLGLLYAMHWPYRQAESARGVRKSVVHDRLAAAGACFGEVAGYE